MSAFLKECAQRLDAGEQGESVLEDMRKRFSTPGCLKVKTCLVRKMCSPTREFTEAVERFRAELEANHGKEVADRFARRVEEEDNKGGVDGKEQIEPRDADAQGEKEEEEGEGGEEAPPSYEEDVRRALRSLPPRLGENVRKLCINPKERKAAKTQATLGRLRKNQQRICIQGGQMLECATRDLLSPTSHELDLALSLLFVTGRRTCELMNGRSSFSSKEGNDRVAHFVGQAKRRKKRGGEGSGEEGGYDIPLLVPFPVLESAMARLRELQGNRTRTNEETSLRYQSALGKRLSGRGDALSAAGRVHSLRSAYACLALHLFRWEKRVSPSFVVMNVLGHTCLEDSLVYTTVHLEDEDALPKRVLSAPALTWEQSYQGEEGGKMK